MIHRDRARAAGEPARQEVRIHYRRPHAPDALFIQRLVHRDSSVLVSYMPATPLSRDLVVHGRPVLQNGSPVVWFTFPGAWYDVGRFHLPDGTFTGIYANILTPVRFLDELSWETTDLYLDVWLDHAGGITVLDEDELAQAEARGWLEPAHARAARAEAARVVELAGRGEWPPRVVDEWTLERVRQVVGEASAAGRER